jgi:hypothetical protein
MGAVSRAHRSQECGSLGTGRPHFSHRQRSQNFAFPAMDRWQIGQSHFSMIRFMRTSYR